MNVLCRSGVAMLLILIVLVPAFSEEALQPEPLSPGEAVSLALQNNPSLREAEGKNAASLAAIDRTQSPQLLQLKLDSRFSDVSKLPSITLPGGAPTLTLGSKDTWLTTLTAQKVIYSGGRLEALVGQATNVAKAAEATSERTRQLVAFGAERAFLLLLAAQQGEDVAQQALVAAEEHLAVAESRYEAKAVPRFDVLRAEVQVEQSRQELIQAQSAIETAHAALLQALGLHGRSFTAVETGLPTNAEIPTLDEALRLAYQQRPEVQALDRQLGAAGEGIRAARAEARPTLGLAADYQLASPESPFQFNRWSVAAVLSLPILDGGNAKAKQREAEAQRDQVMAARDSLLDSVESEVTQSHARAVSAAAQIEVARKQVELAEEMLRVAKVRYEGGIATPTETADSLATLAGARQGLTRALAEWGIARAELRFAMGSQVSGADARQEEAPK